MKDKKCPSNQTKKPPAQPSTDQRASKKVSKPTGIASSSAKGETIRKAASNEVDQLFASAARQTDQKPSKVQEKPKIKSTRDDDRIRDTRGMGKNVRPLTDDGLPIYSAQEMKIGTGGDTDKCPFECDCCF